MRVHVYLFLALLLSAHFVAASEPSSQANLQQSQMPHILVMGDSLSAGYGIDIQQGWVALLDDKLRSKHELSLTNASVSGETSSGGLARLPALLAKHQPTLVILELGGNDGLQGQPLKLLRTNLQTMIDLCVAANAQVILAGMQIPPNYGARYANQFKALYPELAAKNQLPFIPFLLEGVAGHPNLVQQDGIHPTAEAQPIIMGNVLGVVENIVEGVL